jgi:sugar-specific transcriptional regulator TrmB
METKNILNPRTLELLGLTAKEYGVYVALLRLGTAPLRRVAEVAGLNRGTTYDALKRLIDAGLVSYVDAKTHRYFTGEDPHKLRGLATRREVALREASVTLDEVIPRLEDMRGKSEHRPAVRYFEGEAGVREILEDVLRSAERAESKMYRVYSSAGIRDLIASAWPSFTRERIKRGIRVKAIATGGGGATSGLDERKWLSQDASAPTYIFSYAGKTAHVSVDKNKKLFGVIIEDQAIAATQTMIFDGLWKALA